MLDLFVRSESEVMAAAGFYACGNEDCCGKEGTKIRFRAVVSSGICAWGPPRSGIAMSRQAD